MNKITLFDERKKICIIISLMVDVTLAYHYLFDKETYLNAVICFFIAVDSIVSPMV